MSKIQSIAPIYQQQTSRTNKNSHKFGQNPNFTSAANLADTSAIEKLLTEGVGVKIDESFSKNPVNKVVNYFSKLLDKHQGEIQSQVINAVFTTTLAPFFIAYNPFSNQDKQTKEYTALRQPISAGIAITGGFALTNLTNSWVEKMGSEGSFGKFIDMRMVPDKGYLKHQFGKDLNDADDKKVFLDQYKSGKFKGEAFNSNGKPTSKYKKDCLSGYIESVHKNRSELFASLLSEHPDKITIDESTQTILLNGKKIATNVPNLTTKEQLSKYLEENNLHKIKFSKIMEDEFKFEFSSETKKIQPFALRQKLTDTTAMDFLRKLGLFEKGQVDEEELNRFMADTRIGQKMTGGYKRAFKDDVWRDAEGPKILAKTQGKDTARAIQTSIGEATAKAETVNLRQLFERIELTGDALQNLADLDAHSALEKLSKEYLKGLRVAGSTVTKNHKEEFEEVFKGKTVENFAKNMMKNKIAKMGSYFKSFKGYTGIFFNLFIVAITCTILNWSYPKIVKKLFPSLVKDDAPKGGNK